MSKDNFPDGKAMFHVEFKDETFKTKSGHRQASSIKPKTLFRNDKQIVQI